MDIERGTFGEMFHTGLRKAVDSRWSSIAWNAAHLMSRPEVEVPTVWGRYCKWAEEKIKEWPAEPSLQHVRELFQWNPRGPRTASVNLWCLILDDAGLDDAYQMWEWIKATTSKAAPKQDPTKVKVTDEHARRVCMIGQGVLCCRYLTTGAAGWSCQKLGSLREALDAKVVIGDMVAQGDNCEGRAA